MSLLSKEADDPRLNTGSQPMTDTSGEASEPASEQGPGQEDMREAGQGPELALGEIHGSVPAAVFHTALIDLQYMPPVETFARLFSYKRIRFEACEHWVKRSYRNRAHVAGPHGQLVLSIPLVRRGGERRKSGEVKIAYAEPWLHEHWNTLAAGYRRSPFFEYYEDRFEPIFNTELEKLQDRNIALFRFFADALGMTPDISFTEYYDAGVPIGQVDLRNAILPAGGRPDPFYTHPEYGQVFGSKHGFLPNLSIADLLFNEGPRSRELLLNAMG